jgi:hypothetical protein
MDNMPPTSGVAYYLARFMHHSRHYFNSHEPIGEVVQEDVSTEERSTQPEPA